MTLSTGDSTNFYKFNGINGSTADGDTYTYTVNGDSTLELDGFPKITGLTFNESGEYYEIGTTDALIALASYVNDGHDCAGLKFKLTDDIDFSGIDFAGIGTATTAFKGNFIGDEQYSISHLSNCVFNYIDDGANISGLKVYGSNINKSCGIIVDNMLGGTISDCTVKSGTILDFGGEYAGGIVGTGTGGSVINCNVIGTGFFATNAGIIVGQGSTSVSDCKYAGVTLYGATNINNIGTTTEYFLLGTHDGVIVTCTNAETHELTIDDEKFYKSGAELTFTADESKFVKIKAIKVGGNEISGNTYTVEGDIDVTVEGFPKITGLNFNSDGEYYEISSVADLQALATYVSQNHDCAGLTFKLTDNIDLTDADFTAIEGFSGTFDGNGKLITTNKAIFSGDTGTISGGYYYGTSIGAFTQVYALNLPSDVEVEGAINFGGKYYAQNGAAVTIVDETFTIDGDKYYYVDSEGKIRLTDATILDGSETTLNEGWYIVNSDLTIDEQLYFTGDVHLILADGAKLTINSDLDGIFIDGTLNIYGQTLGTGNLDVTSNYGSGIFANNGDININGGKVTADGYLDGIFANNAINLSWTKATDFIDASSYSVTPTFTKNFYDDNGDIITSGNTPSGKISALDGFIVEIPAGVTITSDNATKIGTTSKYLCAANAELTLSAKTGYVVDDSITITGDTEIKATLDAESGKHYVFSNGNGTYTLATASNTNNYPDLIQVYAVTLPEGVNIASGTYATANGKTYATGSITFSSETDIKGLERGDGGIYTVNIDSDVAFELVTVMALTLTNSDASAMTLAADVGTVDGSARTKAIKIVGNELNNSIVGGSGNDTLDGSSGDDTLTGNAGNDTFIYNGGKDIITDYGVGTDKISITSEYQSYSIDGNDLIFNFGENNSLPVKNAANIPITLNGASKKFTAEGVMTGTGTAITLNSDVTNYAADETVVTINASATNGATVIGNDKSNRFYGSSGADTFIYEHTEQEKISYTSVEGGGVEEVVSTIYSAGSDVIYNYGAGDKISLASGVELKDAYKQNDDVVVKVDSGTITVKDSVNKSIMFVQGEEEITFSGDVFSKANTSILPATFTNEVTLGAGTNNLDAFKRTAATKLTGNELNNSIVGGKSSDTLDGDEGNDTLTGGEGSDTFIYNSGKDVITDYGNGTDKIVTASEYQSYTFDGEDIIFHFDGENSLTVKNGVGKSLNINGVAKNFSADKTFNSNNTAVTLGATAIPFDATEIETLVTIDGSAVTSGLEVVGNAKANKIYAGKNGSTLDGGSGNDTLIGGDGADKFVYGVGNDVIDNYGAGDKISLASDVTITDFYKTNADLFIKFSAGSLTVKNTSSSVTFIQDGKEFSYSNGKLVGGGLGDIARDLLQ